MYSTYILSFSLFFLNSVFSHQKLARFASHFFNKKIVLLLILFTLRIAIWPLSHFLLQPSRNITYYFTFSKSRSIVTSIITICPKYDNLPLQNQDQITNTLYPGANVAFELLYQHLKNSHLKAEHFSRLYVVLIVSFLLKEKENIGDLWG